MNILNMSTGLTDEDWSVIEPLIWMRLLEAVGGQITVTGEDLKQLALMTRESMLQVQVGNDAVLLRLIKRPPELRGYNDGAATQETPHS